MSQIFILKLATDSLSSDAKKIGVTVQQLMQIEVKVTAKIHRDTESDSAAVSANQACLHLNYEISLPEKTLTEQLHWPSWQQNNVGFDDYLWEQTCLECFITSDANSYIEINANPDGRYAVYQFENYRYPTTLPPVALLQPQSNKRAQINWIDTYPPQTKATETTQINESNYKRSLSLPLAQLPYDLSVESSKTLLHPCVILYFGNVALYFAPVHASPADFHQRQYWSAFY